MGRLVASLLILLLFFSVVFFQEDVALLLRGSNGGSGLIVQADNRTAAVDSGAESASLGNASNDSILWNALVRTAEAANYTCGNDTLPASIESTVLAGDVRISLSTRHAFRDGSPFVPLDVVFRAHDEEGRPRHRGGDLFVVEVQSHWPSPTISGSRTTAREYVVVRSAAYSRDGLDGMYVVTLSLPRMSTQRVEASLRHYSTCFEGLTLPDQLQGEGSHHSHDFGPLVWKKAAEGVQSFLVHYDFDNDTTKEMFGNDNDNNNLLPKCSESPNREDVLHGAWVERLGALPSIANLTATGAAWTPFNCSLDNMRPHAHVRIGDSTMPQRNVEIGIPYTPYINEHGKRQQAQYMEALLEYNRTSHANDTFTYGGGLHHLFHGHFGVRAVADLVIRTVCQAGLVFSGSLFLRGPNPIQQHLHATVDQTALNVRRINWEIRSRLEAIDFKLARLCGSMPADELAGFVCLPDREDNIMPDKEAEPILLQKFNYSWDRDASADQTTLANWIRSMSVDEREQRYGTRKVGWIDLEEFLLPRSEAYRKNNKIHDGSEFFFGPHADILGVIEGYA